MSLAPAPDPDDAYDSYLHEIKSTFTVILGTTQILERRIRSGHEVSSEQILSMLERIRDHVIEAHGLVHSIDMIIRQWNHPSTD